MRNALHPCHDRKITVPDYLNDSGNDPVSPAERARCSVCPAAHVRCSPVHNGFNWRKHFARLDWLVKGVAIDEFIAIIKVANQERIWEYSKLEEFQLPYVFATLMEFPPYGRNVISISEL